MIKTKPPLSTMFCLHLLLSALATACLTPRAQSTGITHFYSDLDGTLLDKQHEIHPENLAAIERYRKTGGRVGIATGRLQDRAMEFARAIKADLPLIFGNGAVITDPKGTLIRMLAITDTDDVRAICDEIAKTSCSLVYIAWGNTKTGEVKVEMGACRPSDQPSFGVIRIRARKCAAHSALLNKLPTVTRGTYSVIESGTGEYLGVSIAALGVQKGAALEFVASRLGIDPSQMAFVGDSGNDISAVEMLQKKGGRCFAIRNATEGLKAACPRHTTRDNQQGGVGECIRQVLDEER